MKVLLVLACLSILALANLEQDAKEWTNFKQKHAKIYSNVQEEKLRFSIFQSNLKTINEHNERYRKGQETYRMGVNQFTDMTKQEYLDFLKTQTMSKPNYETTGLLQGVPLQGDVPKTKDWREVGAVSPVKNQGECGSCWAFSAVATVESFYYLKNKEMVLFSEQQLVDCVTTTHGCNGGDEAPALEYIKNNGIQTEDSYPYKAETNNCKRNAAANVTTIQGYVQLKKSEDELLQAVGLLGPISVALDASELSSYAGGVFRSKYCSQSHTNHAVLAVGYGYDEEAGLDYWLIKNSWGEIWGEQGYFKLQRGVNMCAIAVDNVYPVL